MALVCVVGDQPKNYRMYRRQHICHHQSLRSWRGETQRTRGCGFSTSAGHLQTLLLSVFQSICTVPSKKRRLEIKGRTGRKNAASPFICVHRRAPYMLTLHQYVLPGMVGEQRPTERRRRVHRHIQRFVLTLLALTSLFLLVPSFSCFEFSFVFKQAG